MEFLPIKRALLSVTDKSGLVELARFLVDNGVELVSTGGTRKMLAQAGLPVVSVSDVTGFPEILGGRVKTLHPHIHAGVLADKDNPDHLATLTEKKIAPFDLICVNLYNFAQAVSQAMDLKAAVEQIDIGGPTLLRAGAKNFHSMTVLPDIGDYLGFMKELQTNEMQVSLDFRRAMAVKTFSMISEYDRMIAEYLGRDGL
jgi:phosphoribosylaminoimidazolecarboxamide formyltransferase/IMP cyclohydrolase